MNTDHRSTGELDLVNVLKAAQAISGEIMLDKLLDKLLQIVLENSGADKAGFIREHNNRLVVEAMLALSPETTPVHLTLPLEASADMCVAIVQEVARIREMVVLDEAIHLASLANDPYLTTRQPRSICCLPLLHQSQLRGILYLENSLTAGVFTPTRLEVLQLLAALAATTLENARLYDQARQELSDRQRAETALVEERNLLRTLIDNLPDRIYVKDRESRFVIVNPGVADLFGVTRPEEIIGKSDFDFHSSEGAAKFYADEQALMRSGQPLLNQEVTGLNRTTGQQIWDLATKIPLRDRQGQIVGLIGVNRDITQRKQAEEALRESEARYRSLFEDSPISLWEEDFSAVKARLDSLRAEGVTDLRTYFTNHPEVVAECIALIKVIDVNKTTLTLYKAGSKEALLSGLSRIIEIEDSFQGFVAELLAMANGQTKVEIETHNYTLTGEKKYIELKWSVAPGYEQTLAKILISITDITARKQAEEALKQAHQQERYLRQVADSLREVSTILSSSLELEEVLTQIFKQLAQVIRYEGGAIFLVDGEDLILSKGIGPFAQHHEGDRIPVASPNPTARCFRSKQLLILNEASQEPHWIDWPEQKPLQAWIGAPLVVDQGVIGLLTVDRFELEDPYKAEDAQFLQAFANQAALALHNARLYDQARQELAERQRAEAALAEERNLLRTLIDNLPDQIYIKDRESRFVMVNPQVFQSFGLTKPEEIVGKSDFDFDPPELVTQFYADEQEIMRSGQPLLNQEQSALDLVTGQKRWFLSTKVPLRDHQGKIIGTIGINRNITERKQAEEELQKYRDHLEELVEARTAELQATNALLKQEIAERKRVEKALKAANAELSQYAYVVSHDLQAPLRAIHQYTDFLQEDLASSLTGDQEIYLQSLARAGREAEALVRDLLDLSRVGRHSGSAETIDLSVFLQLLVGSLDLPADVEINLAEEWPTLQTDPVLLRQIFQNLILNGVKFNHAEPKRLELGWRPVQPAGYELYVRDNGIGINLRYQEQIFQPFRRLHTQQEYEGTGIGLAIVKKAVDKLHGSIRVESRPGEGSAFFVTLRDLAELPGGVS